MKRRRKTSEGFTLVELLVAITILVAVVVPMTHLFIQASSRNGKAKSKNNATVMAQNVMEKYKNISIEELYNSVMVELPDSVVSSDTDGDGLNDAFVFQAYEKDGTGSAITDSTGHYYLKGASGEKYFVEVAISPEGYKTDNYVDSEGNDVSKTLINSYESPVLSDLYNGNNIVVTDELTRYDAYASAKLGFPQEQIVKTTTLLIETTAYKEASESEYRFKTTVYCICSFEGPSGAPYTTKRAVATKRFEITDHIPDIYLLYKAYNSSGGFSTDKLIVSNKYILNDGATMDTCKSQIPRINIIDSQIYGSSNKATISNSNISRTSTYAYSVDGVQYALSADEYVKLYTDIEGITNSKGLAADGDSLNSLYTIQVTVREKTYDAQPIVVLSSAKEAYYESKIK